MNNFNQEEEKKFNEEVDMLEGFVLQRNDANMLKELFRETVLSHDARRDEFMEANLENSAWAKAYRLMCHEELRERIVEVLDKTANTFCDNRHYGIEEVKIIINQIFPENNNK